MATAPGASLLGPIPFADVEVDSGLVSGVPVQLAEENADADLVSALPSAPRPNNGLPELRFYEGHRGLFVSRRGEAKLEALPSPRVMNTHMPLAMIPRAAAPGGGGCKVVYICRQPKDMVVSRWDFHRRLHPELAFADVFEAVCSGAVAYGPAKTCFRVYASGYSLSNHSFLRHDLCK
ncbi:Flavonol sulfotransferase-like protein [Triticum urartu]|uniref:Sulfotransferase n=1 Tax=Triticum urartu TaxID=4572 RepID=M7ZGB8_TRIUA|nr:Flavonol sulfotransferase-like protein [Triticum urartu]